MPCSRICGSFIATQNRQNKPLIFNNLSLSFSTLILNGSRRRFKKTLILLDDDRMGIQNKRLLTEVGKL